MKNPATLITKAKITVMMLMAIGISQPLVSQNDTLHLNYVQVQTKMPDSTEAKIAQWAKSLNGRHVDVNVIAYYHKSEFKKYAQERADEMFLILNRKARALITIQSINTKKGESSQRSRVDVIYTSSGGATAPVAKTEPAKPKAAEEKPAAPAAVKTESKQKPAPAKKEAVAKTESQPTEVKAAEEPAPAKKEKAVPAAPIAAKNMVFSPNIELKERKLMVVLITGNQIYNDNVTNAFKNSWKDSEVGFITDSELAAAGQDKKAEWVLLIPEKKEQSGLTFMTYQVAMTYVKGKKYEEYKKPFKIAVRNDASEADLTLLIYKIRVYYAFREEFNRGQLKESLAAKTLYVDKALTEVTESEFKAEYPFPVMFATADEVAGHANSKESGAAYLKMDANGSTLNLLIVDAETGAIMARTESGVNKNGFKKAAIGTLSDSGKQMQYFPLTIYN